MLLRRVILLFLLLILILSVINYLFLINVLNREALISLFETYISPDHVIYYPIYTLIVIQGGLLIGFLILLMMISRDPKKKLSFLNLSSFILCCIFVLLSVIFSAPQYFDQGIFREDYRGFNLYSRNLYKIMVAAVRFYLINFGFAVRNLYRLENKLTINHPWEKLIRFVEFY